MPEVTVTPEELKALEDWRAGQKQLAESYLADDDFADDDDDDDDDEEDGRCPECGALADEDCDEDCSYYDEDDDDDDDDPDAFV